MTVSFSAAPVTVAALYRFAHLPDPEALRARLHAFCAARGIRGTLLLAGEGINGTVAGDAAAIAALVETLGTMPELAGIAPRISHAQAMPFRRLKVRVKPEVVTMGVAAIDPRREAGRHVEPEAWNALIADPDTVVIDTRNAYEVAFGTFAGAVDPGTGSFRGFPAWLEDNLDRLRGRKVAMFCTGGIRCEKATAYARRLGLDAVFHLRGGILAYLERVAPEQSRWQGECFVFDGRVSLVHGLGEGRSGLCRACGRAVAPAGSADAAPRCAACGETA